jgi:sigma-B regulation protein RsbU (phosphoserine phosphatase)
LGVTFLAMLAPRAALATPDPALDLSPAEKEWLNTHPSIRVAPAPNFPPFEFFDEAGTYKGIVADYLALLENRLGLKFEIKRMETWQDVVDGTKAGEADVWLEAVDTPERRAFMTFTKPYLHMPVVFLVRKDSSISPTHEGLKGHRLAAVKGYSSTTWLAENYPGVDLVEVPSLKVGLEKVSFGAADVLAANLGSASFYIAQTGIGNLKVAGPTGYEWHLSMGVRNELFSLIGILEKALATVSDEEGLAIRRRWIGMEEGSPTARALRNNALPLGLGSAALLALLVFVFRKKTHPGQEAVGFGLQGAWPIYVFALVGIGLVAGIAYWSQGRLGLQAQRDTGNALGTVLRTTSLAVDDWLKTRQAEGRMWANKAEIQVGAEMLLAKEQGEGTAAIQRRLNIQSELGSQLGGILESTSFRGAVIVGPNFSVLASHDEQAFPPGLILTPSDAFKKGVHTSPRFAALDVPEKRVQKGGGKHEEADLMLGVRIPSESYEATGTLIFLMSPEAEFSSILQRGRIGDSGESYAFNRRGRMISASRFEEDLQRAGLLKDNQGSVGAIRLRDPGGNLLTGHRPALEPDQQPLTLMAQDAIGGGSGKNLLGYRDYRGVKVIGVWTWNGHWGFGIATEIDVEEAYSSLTTTQRITTLSTAFAAFLILVLTFIFVRSRAQMQGANLRLEGAFGTIKKNSHRMEAELKIGHDIQMSMVPLTFPAFPDQDEIEIHAALIPARELGGDFYDFFLIDDEHLCFCIADVSGKGVASALFMAVTKTLIKLRASQTLSPAELLSRVNDEVEKSNSACMFVTVFLGILNFKNGALRYCNAGHNPPYLLRADGEVERIDDRHGPVVGAVSDLNYEESFLSLEPGDQIFLYTDGVTEAMDVSQTLFSEKKLVRILESDFPRDPKKATQRVLDEVWAFQGSADQADDVTVLSVEFHGSIGTQEGRLELVLDNKTGEIERANELFNLFALEHRLDQRIRRKINVALDDLLTNVIRYAYPQGGDHLIEVRIELDKEGIRIQIQDDGMPFDPFDEVEPDTELSLEDRDVGGLGIHLVEQMMDQVMYQRVDDKNVVQLFLQLA